MADRLPKLLAGLAVLVGVGALLAGLSVFVEAWQASRAWADHAEIPQAELSSEQPPLWLDAPPPTAISGEVTQRTPLPRRDPTPMLPVADAGSRGLRPPRPSGDAERGGRVAADDIGADEVHPSMGPAPGAEVVPSGPERDGVPTPPPRQVTPADIRLAETDFRFLTPPEPGAHARLAVTLENHADVSSGPVSLVLSARWLKDYSVLGAVPEVLDDRPLGDAERRFDFPGLDPGERRTVELHLLATADEVAPPAVRLLLAQADTAGPAVDIGEIGQAQPRTVAPRPRPGPVRSVIVPKLGVRASVVPVAWEPPPFVVGQLRDSAAVSLGNTVLIGHLAGPEGDVFSRLSQLRPGDEVTATSRGLEYHFVVSEISVRPYDDVTPTEATTTPRLTLMTCTGQWNVLRQDYSHRLWVIAEPPELAQETIRANAARAAEAAREAEAAAAARATHEAELSAQAAPTADAEPSAQTEPTADAESSAQTEPTAEDEPSPMATPSPAPAPAATSTPSAPIAPAAVGAPSGPAGPSANPPAPASAPSASPSPDSSTLVDGKPLAPGMQIDAPDQDARVPERLTVRGRRTSEADADAPLWLLVRAEVEGSRWYILPRPLEPDGNGLWQADVTLGGAAGIRHEIRVGLASPEADQQLRRHAAERPGRPLDGLPEGFTAGARVTVERR